MVNKNGVDMVDMADQSLPIPQYKHKEDETLELRKARWDEIPVMMQLQRDFKFNSKISDWCISHVSEVCLRMAYFSAPSPLVI